MKIDKNKTYTVTQIADIAGVSKASVSRWLSDRHVSPDHTKGKAKYFNATYVEQYLKAHKSPRKATNWRKQAINCQNWKARPANKRKGSTNC